MSAIATAFRRSAATSRIAARELRKRPRDAALVVAMVSLPVAIVMAVGVVSASGEPTHAELVAAELGENQAWIVGVGPAGSQVFQTGDDPYEFTIPGDFVTETDPSVRDPRAHLPADADVIPITRATAVVSTDSAAARLRVLRGATWDPVFRGAFTLTAGAVPTAADEVMVSPGLMERFGLAMGDSLTIGDEAEVRVVGVLVPAHGWDDGAVYGTPELDAGDLGGEITWYVSAPALDADTLTTLTDDGFQVFTRDGVAQGNRTVDPNQSSELPGMIVGGGLGLIEVVLLAGAAFAVGMRRRQHTLALIAATGAQRRELVGIGLASGAWHGVAAGIVGIPVGLLAGWAWLAVLVRWGGAEGREAVWGYHVVPWHALAAFGFGVLAALLASLIPAIASSRVDAMESLRGSQRPRVARSWPLAVGGVLLALGVVAFGVAAHLTDAALDYPVSQAGGARDIASAAQLLAVALAFVGAVMMLPKALGWLASLGAGLGIAPRIAARDSARNAGRTVPVVAAIAVTVALGTGTYLAEVRYDAFLDRALQGQTPVGTGQVNLVQWGDGDTPTYLDPHTIAAKLETALPGATYNNLTVWQDPWSGFEGPFHAITVPPQNVCVEYIPSADGSLSEVSQREIKLDPNCAEPLGVDDFQVAVGDAKLLATLVGQEPSKQALDALASGAVVAFREGLIEDRKVTIAEWDGGQSHTDAFTLDAVVEGPMARLPIVSAMMSPETAAAHGIATQTSTMLVSMPGGLTQADADAAEAVLVPMNTNLVVQTEFSRLSSVIGAVSLAAVGVIALLATGLALGLARAEARRDDFTLASLGASPALAKRAAGWQAALSVFVALALGFAIAVAMDWVRAHEDLGVPYAPPWWNLVAALVVLPAAVGLVCGLATRAPKAIHYRLAA